MHRPTVLLRHDLPDKSSHYDWLLDLAGDGQSALTTFRLPRSVHELLPGEMIPAERIADHRRQYLEYEGPVSSGRGNVSRIAVGDITQFESSDGTWRLDVHWRHPEMIDQQVQVRCEGHPDVVPQTWDAICIAHSPTMS